MAEKRNFNIEINKQTIKLLLDKFRKKISRSYLLIEFGFDYINLCEVINTNGALTFNKIKHLEIPKEALDKSIPTEPEVMGKLISDLIIEENIATKRVAIVISPDAVYTRLIEIPKTIKESKVYEYLCDPNSLIQIPIQLSKSDFTIYKTKYKENSNNNLYFLTAIPKVSMNNLIKTFEVANLEINFVETTFNSLGRLIRVKEMINKDKEYLLFLDFSKQCTFLTLIDNYGPLYSDRISSIRNFPSKIGELNSDENNDYLPISKYDLKVVSREIKSSLNKFFKNEKSELTFKLILSGFYSSHPNLTKVLSDYIKLPAFLISPTSSKEIANVKYSDENFYEAIFTNLFGLGLGLLDRPKINKTLKTIDHDYLGNFIEYHHPIKSVQLNKNSSLLNSKDKQEEKISFQKDEYKNEVFVHKNLQENKIISKQFSVKTNEIVNEEIDNNTNEIVNNEINNKTNEIVNEEIDNKTNEIVNNEINNKTNEIVNEEIDNKTNAIVNNEINNKTNEIVNEEISSSKKSNFNKKNKSENEQGSIETKSNFKLDTEFLDL